MNQSTIIFGYLAAAFVIFITQRGELPVYAGFLLSTPKQPASGPMASGSGSLGVPSSPIASGTSVGNAASTAATVGDASAATAGEAATVSDLSSLLPFGIA